METSVEIYLVKILNGIYFCSIVVSGSWSGEPFTRLHILQYFSIIHRKTRPELGYCITQTSSFHTLPFLLNLAFFFLVLIIYTYHFYSTFLCNFSQNPPNTSQHAMTNEKKKKKRALYIFHIWSKFGMFLSQWM